jgi:hypothetical protein
MRSPPRVHAGFFGQRGFALPLVLLVFLVCSFVLTVILQRHGASALAVQRQVDQYVGHHELSGLQEMIDRWTQLAQPSIKETLETDGLAFSMSIADGTQINVFLYDAQGAALGNTSSLAGRQRLIAARTAELLRELTASGYRPSVEEGGVDTRTGAGIGGGTGELLRSGGPAMICVGSAPEAVLRALAQSVIDPDKVESVVQAITALQSKADEEPITMQEVNGALRDIGIEGQGLTDLQSMLVDNPVLWRVVAVTESGGRVIRRTSGLMLSVRADSTTLGRTTQFLQWEVLPARE